MKYMEKYTNTFFWDDLVVLFCVSSGYSEQTKLLGEYNGPFSLVICMFCLSKSKQLCRLISKLDLIKHPSQVWVRPIFSSSLAGQGRPSYLLCFSTLFQVFSG